MLRYSTEQNPDLPTHHVLYMIVHQIDHLGLSKKPLKTLMAKAKKALNDEAKIEVINALNGEAATIWRKFLNIQIEKGTGAGGKRASAQPTLPVLSNYLLAIILFQINAYGLSRTPVAPLMARARKAKDAATRLAITKEINSISEIVFRAFRAKFSDPEEQVLQEKMEVAVPEVVALPPAKKRVKKVVEKIEKKQEAKIEDLAVVQRAIVETPAQEPTLEVLRERALALKVDISDLGRKKKEILKRLEMAEAGVLPVEVPVVPKEVVEDAALAPEPERRPASKDISKFISKTRDQVMEDFMSFDVRALEKDLNAEIAKRLPGSKKYKVEIRLDGSTLDVFRPPYNEYKGNISEYDVENAANAILGELGATKNGGGISANRNYSMYKVSPELAKRYGTQGSIEEDLEKLPIPNSPSDLALMLENLKVSIDMVQSKHSMRGYEDYMEWKAPVQRWVGDVLANVMGTTPEQYTKSFVEYVSALDPNYTLICEAGREAYFEVKGKAIYIKNPLFEYIYGERPEFVEDLTGFVPRSKLRFPQGKQNYDYVNKIAIAATNATNALNGLLGAEGAWHRRGVDIPTITRDINAGDSVAISISVDRLIQDNSEVAVAPRIKEILDMVMKTMTDAGFTINQVRKPEPLGQGSRKRGVKKVIDLANSKPAWVSMNGGVQYTHDDVYMFDDLARFTISIKGPAK
jgi:hypothetical protein